MSASLKSCLFLLWSASAYADTSTLYAVVGSECVEMTLNAKDRQYVKSFVDLASPLQDGTCSDHGYTVEDEAAEQPVRTPFASEGVTVKTMRMSAWESSKLAAQAFLTAPVNVFAGSRQSPLASPLPAIADDSFAASNDVRQDATSHCCAEQKVAGNWLPVTTVVAEGADAPTMPVCIDVPSQCC
jgi:hypothetical protein